MQRECYSAAVAWGGVVTWATRFLASNSSATRASLSSRPRASTLAYSDHAHLRERLLHARAPQADILDGRHDAAEEAAAERASCCSEVVDVLDAFLGRQAEPLPHLRLIEAVAHVVAGVDDELLALVALGIAELRIDSRAAPAGRRRRAAPRPA